MEQFITLYPNWENIECKVWIQKIKDSVVCKVDKILLDAIIHFDLNEVARPIMKKLYNNNQQTELDKIKEKFNLVWINRNIKWNPNK